MSIEAMKQALEALEGLLNKTRGQAIYSFMETERRIAISACVGIRQAIAEAEKQEPVAWYDSESGWTDFHSFKPARKPSSPSAKWLPLYTRPQPKREWVGLTDEEEQELDEKYGDDISVYIDQRDLKLKEKNT